MGLKLKSLGYCFLVILGFSFFSCEMGDDWGNFIKFLENLNCEVNIWGVVV